MEGGGLSSVETGAGVQQTAGGWNVPVRADTEARVQRTRLDWMQPRQLQCDGTRGHTSDKYQVLLKTPIYIILNP